MVADVFPSELDLVARLPRVVAVEARRQTGLLIASSPHPSHPTSDLARVEELLTPRRLPAEPVVRFSKLDSTVHPLDDGTVVVRGGGGALGANGRPVQRSFDWAAPPNPVRPFGAYFLVADVMGS